MVGILILHGPAAEPGKPISEQSDEPVGLFPGWFSQCGASMSIPGVSCGRLSANWRWGLAVLALLLLVAPGEASVIPLLDLGERIAAADAIVVARLATERTFWNTQRTAILTERVFTVEEVLCDARGSVRDGQLVLVFWGGTIGSRTNLIPGMPDVEPNVSYLLFADMRPVPPACPLVGYGQGLIERLDAAVHGRSLALAGNGQLMLRVLDAAAPDEYVPLLAASPAEVDAALTFDEVVAMVRETIRTVGCGVASRTPAADAQSPAGPMPAKQPGTAGRGSRLMPRRTALSHKPPMRPPLTSAFPTEQYGDPGTVAAVSVPDSDAATQGREERYILYGYAELPVVMNPLPEWMIPWAPNDQYVMSRWNAYAQDVFHVWAEPSGTFEWDDGVWDVCGWPTSEQLIEAGYPPWGGETALTWANLDDGEILEADVGFNPAHPWTLDDEAVWAGTDLGQPFRGIALHEFGHVWGANHNFDALCIMNYSPRMYGSFWIPYADDVAGLRANYPAHAIPRSDAGVYLYSYQGGWMEMTFNPGALDAGQSLTLNDVWIENVGTSPAAPGLNWYVSPTRSLTGMSRFVGQTTHGELVPGAHAIVDPLLTVPTSVPPGPYYVGVVAPPDDIGWNSLMFSRASVLIRPFNNDCSAAVMLSPGSTPFTTLYATTDFSDSCPLGADIWYRLLPPCTGGLILDLCDSNFDTCVALYAGWTCPPTAGPLACSDDACGAQSYLEVDVDAGVPYLVRIGGWSGATGSGYIVTELTTTSGNDSCFNSIPVGEGSHAFSTSCATTDGNPDCYPLGQDIWFDYDATCSGPLLISLCGSSYDTMLAVYEGYYCPPAVLPLLACDDDSCGTSSEAQIEVVAGQRYLIRVGGYNDETGTGTLTIQAGAANNTCAHKQWVTEGVFPFSNRCATTDGPTETPTCGEYATPYADIWFCYLATRSGWATARLCDVDFDSVVAVYLGCACPGGPDTALACDDDSCRPGSLLSFWVDEGTQRLIRVGGYNGETGDGVLEILCGECAADTDCDDGNPCTADRCEIPDCVHTPISGDCDDADPCTIADSCVDGQCVGQPMGCSMIWWGGCLSGPDIRPHDACPCLDDDEDRDVDLHDFARTQIECIAP